MTAPDALLAFGSQKIYLRTAPSSSPLQVLPPWGTSCFSEHVKEARQEGHPLLSCCSCALLACAVCKGSRALLKQARWDTRTVCTYAPGARLMWDVCIALLSDLNLYRVKYTVHCSYAHTLVQRPLSRLGHARAYHQRLIGISLNRWICRPHFDIDFDHDCNIAIAVATPRRSLPRLNGSGENAGRHDHTG